MPTEDAFLRAIQSDPTDDLPRLVYADWLEENGDPDRAAFIRLQIETAKLPNFTPERNSSEEREKALLEANRERWQEPLAGFVRSFPHLIVFRRGFVEELELRNYDQWTTHGMADFLRSPLVALTRLTFSTNDGDPLHSTDMVHDMLDYPELEHLLTLQFHELEVQCGAMETVAVHPRLRRLHALGFWACDLTDHGVPELAKTFALPQVRSLRLHHASLRDADVSALADSPRLADLTGLGLPGNSRLTDASARALAESPHLGRLTNLNVQGCERLTEAGKVVLRARFGDGLKV